MIYDIIFQDPDHEEKIFEVEIEDITTYEEYPRFHAKIPSRTKDWSKEPEQQVIDYIIDMVGTLPDEITSEFI